MNAGRAAEGAAPRTLAESARGDRVRIVSVGGASTTAQRLLELGLVPGTAVEVVRFAPLGDPIEVKVRGYALSLRRDDARCVCVESLA